METVLCFHKTGKMRTVPIFLISLGLLVVAGCEPAASNWTPLEPSVPAPEFSLPALGGGRVSLSDVRGQVVIMEFWATWCGPCHYSTPSLEAIYRAYHHRGVTVLLVNAGESAEDVRAWAGQRFTAPILLDEDGQVARLYQVHGIPRLLVIDQGGQIRYDRSGYAGGLELNLKLILTDLLAEARPAPQR